jgi:hypothetical protein
MLKSELIARLQEVEGDPEILLASDEEWNSLSPLYSFDPVQAHNGAWGWETVHPDDIEEFEELDEEDKLVNALVLWG